MENHQAAGFTGSAYMLFRAVTMCNFHDVIIATKIIQLNHIIENLVSNFSFIFFAQMNYTGNRGVR